jgi:predicted RNA binding protein YcfA (HicA-like mRNA interferase family)
VHLRSRAGLRGCPHRFLPSRRAFKVKEAIRRVEGAGWELARTRGSHRQYRHPNQPGLVTIAGKPSDTLHPKTWASIVKQAGISEQDR